jgi:hypothetical protein
MEQREDACRDADADREYRDDDGWKRWTPSQLPDRVRQVSHDRISYSATDDPGVNTALGAPRRSNIPPRRDSAP